MVAVLLIVVGVLVHGAAIDLIVDTAVDDAVLIVGCTATNT